jgi:hypothetical protein
MAAQGTSFRHLQSIAGTAMVTLGIFILYQNLAGVVVRLSYVLAGSGSEASEEPFAFLQAVLYAYVPDQQRFLQGFCQQMLVSFWPLLLVMFGTVLSRYSSADHVNVSAKKRMDLSN